MTANMMAELTMGAVWVFFGVWTTLYGFRYIGKRPGESIPYDDLHRNYGPSFKLFGPLLIAFGVFSALAGIMRPS